MLPSKLHRDHRTLDFARNRLPMLSSSLLATSGGTEDGASKEGSPRRRGPPVHPEVVASGSHTPYVQISVSDLSFRLCFALKTRCSAHMIAELILVVFLRSERM